MVGLQQRSHGQVWPDAESREPLRHWHSAPYATLEGYRLECDAQRMMVSAGTDGFSAAKAELGPCDPLAQLQVCFNIVPGPNMPTCTLPGAGLTSGPLAACTMSTANVIGLECHAVCGSRASSLAATTLGCRKILTRARQTCRMTRCASNNSRAAPGCIRSTPMEGPRAARTCSARQVLACRMRLLQSAVTANVTSIVFRGIWHPASSDLCAPPRTGKDIPGSGSLTQEEQVSSLTMGGLDDCLFSMDLPALHIPRCPSLAFLALVRCHKRCAVTKPAARRQPPPRMVP